jgi:membrane associated rhomboid family serine protease
MLLPIRTDRPRIRPAYVTATLIVVNTLVYLYSVTVSPVGVPFQIGRNLFHLEAPRLIEQYGLHGDHPTLLAFITHLFLHGDLFHLVGNVLFLWIFGSLIEDAIGALGFAAVYFGGGVAAALVDLGMSRSLGSMTGVMMGASGAVSAIMGLFMLRFYRTRVQICYWIPLIVQGTIWVRSLWALLYFLVIDLVSGLLDASAGGGGVAHWAHVGGFAAGALAAPFLASLSAARKEDVANGPATNVEHVRRSAEAEAAERALRAEPANAYLMRRLAQAYRSAGESALAVQTYQRCICSFANRNLLDQGAETYLELLEYDETATLAPEVQIKVARQLERMRAHQAAAAYSVLVERHPAAPDAEFALLRLAALQLEKLHQPYEAARYLDEFLRRYPSSRWAAEARQAREKLAAKVGSD